MTTAPVPTAPPSQAAQALAIVKATQEAQLLLNKGVTITSTSTPYVDGTYKMGHAILPLVHNSHGILAREGRTAAAAAAGTLKHQKSDAERHQHAMRRALRLPLTNGTDMQFADEADFRKVVRALATVWGQAVQVSVSGQGTLPSASVTIA